MKFPDYKGQGDGKGYDARIESPSSRIDRFRKPEKYIADPGLVDACNVALLLGQPLLLTGQPGTGKTLFAYSLAWELGLDEPLKFETKSNSMARDLFYTYDALKRFQDVQSKGQNEKSDNSLDYLTYQALGKAILLTREKAEVAKFLPTDFEHKGKKRTVVLIDEVDKAPRDFPNDILNELDLLYFRIPELGNIKIEADRNPELQPIVIITSNSEKDLPEAFLRRCVYYDIPFPDDYRLRQIINNRLGLFASGTNQFLDDALDLFQQLRSPQVNLNKKPATAELLGWLLTLQKVSGNAENPLAETDLAKQTLSSLVKTAADQQKATQLVNTWMEERRSRNKAG
ncbi:MAG: MoxR family ATPase [Xenococcus sp. MO_188.B8]|nr:MoxR family ATPase [Xenococcus sp. MO_188.B8]